MHILDGIPFELDLEALLRRAHLEPGSADAGAFERLVEQARRRGRPKAICKACYVRARGADTVTLDGVTFRSRALRANLDSAERVFAYVATCGREVEEIDLPEGDFLAQFWLDTIKAALLWASVSHLTAYLERRYALGRTASMSPGSGDVTVWPIEQQRPLFSLLGDVRALIGVELTGSFLMLPTKTVSGIRFPTAVDFRSCQLCHRPDCPSRSAPFDPALWEAVEHGQDPVTARDVMR